MRQTVRLLLVAAIVAVVAGVAVAQSSISKVTIGFGFDAAGEAMPAGDYTVEVSSDPSSGRVIMRNGAKSAVLLVITRLGRHDNDKDPEIVFDKVDGKYLLSEVWLSGEDGYLLLATKTAHGHFVVGGSHPSK
jgi:hypothetical protein